MKVELPETIEESHELIKNLLAIIEKMQTQIDELTARLNQNSQNSNRPPSGDGFRKQRVALPKKKRKKGGQFGHSGKTLKRVETPDRVVRCEPLSCQCGKPEWITGAEIIETRQVFELPAPRLEVIEYQRLKRVCECGRQTSGKFPEEVTAPVQYGLRVRTLVTLLSVHGCLSYAKISQLFGDIYGLELNTATAQMMVHKSAEQMPLEALKAGVLASEVVHFDETGITQEGQLKWLHTASTEYLTYQFVHDKRGAAAMSGSQSVLPQFTGIGIHDCWASYFRFSRMQHAICNAHVLRELTGIIENNQSKWGRRMKRLLLDMYVKSDSGKGVIQEIGHYENRYRKILDEAEREEPPPERVNRKGKLKRTKGRNLLERLRKYKEAVLLFAKEQAVPFTNNQAERDIRPAKVKQKVTGGFRAASGSRSYSRIQSFISTLRKQKRQVFEELLSVIAGNPFELFQS